MKFPDSHLTTLAEKLGQLLQKKNLKLVSAESCTGGGVAYVITGIPGISQTFERGFVTYSNLSKQTLLNVPENILNTYGAVSEETAKAMAKGALNNSDANISISITGIAGPNGGSREKPVGTVWFGIAGKSFETKTLHKIFSGSREEIRTQAIQEAISFVITQVQIL